MNHRPSYYGRDGQPMGHMEWAERFGHDRDYKRVALTQVGELSVSTVWLGLDHNFAGVGPPLIFETMIHDDAADDWLEDQWRYASEADARAGHEQVVATLRSAQRRGDGTQ